MSIRFRIVLAVAVVAMLIVVIHRIRRKKLSLNYSLLWLLMGFLLLLFLIFPELIYGFSDMIGVGLPLNLLLIGFAFFTMAMLFYMTGIVSRSNEQVRSLTQQVALLEKRIRELEDQKKPEE